MKTNLLLFIFAIAASVAFGQAKQSQKSDEKPMRKIASGNGAKQIEEEVAQAMRELEVELKDLDIKIDMDVRESLEGLDEQIEHDIERDMEGLDEQIEASVEASLEGLDETIEASLEGLDEHIGRSIEASLEVLNHLDFNFDFNFNQNLNIDHHGDIEEFRREALKGANDDQKSTKEKDTKDKPKKDPKEN